MGAIRARRRKLLTQEEIDNLMKGLTEKFGGTWGYHGSYARGRATIRSDIDIIYKDLPDMGWEEYCSIFTFIESIITISYDLGCFEAWKESDERLDAMGIEEGLGVIRQIIWSRFCQFIQMRFWVHIV